MYLFLVITLVRAQVRTGIISVVNLLQNETQKFDIKFEEFQFMPQISYSLVGIQIDTDLPRQLAFRPKLQTITKTGFRFLVVGGPTIINYLEFQWWAVNDDRLKLGCQHFDDLADLNSVKDLAVGSFTIPFERFFSTIPQVQIYLAGLSKQSQKQDLSLSMKISTVNRDSFEIQVQKKSAHKIDGLDVCYIASNQIEVKSINKVDQRADEFIDFEGLEGNLFYGVSRISHHYGILMVQLGESDIEDTQVGINQIDISIAELPQDGFMNCALGYFKCNYQGTPVYLCDSLDNWKMLKSVRIVKGAQKNLNVGGGKFLDISQSFDCIKNINSILKEDDIDAQNISSIDFEQPSPKINQNLQNSLDKNKNKEFIQFLPPNENTQYQFEEQSVKSNQEQLELNQEAFETDLQGFNKLLPENDLLGDDLIIFQKYISVQPQTLMNQMIEQQSQAQQISQPQESKISLESSDQEVKNGIFQQLDYDDADEVSHPISKTNKKLEVQADQSLSKLEQLLKHDNENYYSKYQKQTDDKGKIIVKKQEVNKQIEYFSSQVLKGQIQ